MQKYQDVAINRGSGNPVSGATVTVTTLAGASATIYSDNGVTPINAPLTTGADGAFAFYAADGRYNITISGNGFPAKTITDVLLEDPVAAGVVSVTAAPYNAVGNGSADDSVAIQACIDANKGKRILLPAGFTFYGAGILLSGSTYNGTRLVVDGEFKLKPAPTLGSNNFISCWAGIVFQDCDRCGIEGRFDGNRTAQQDREHTHVAVLAGVTNFSIPRAFVREIRGDGFYVSQKLIGSSSTNSDGLVIGVLHGENTADDGRNLLSIISCDNVSVGTFHSMKIGGTVGGVLMPGGLDIEPDQTYESCKNITIGAVNVTTAGTSGLAVQGRSGTTVTQNVNIGTAIVVNTCAPSLADGIGNTTVTNNHTLLIGNASDVTVRSYNGKFTNAYGDAVLVTDSDRVRVVGSVSHVREGARIGGELTETNGARNCDIRLDVDSTVRFGIRTGLITDTNIRGKVTTPLTGFYVGSLFAVHSLGSFAQTRCTYSVDVPYHADWTRAYKNDLTFPCTYTDTKIAGVDFSPGASWASYLAMKDMALPIYNAIGYTDGSTRGIPTTGPHVAGQYVRNGAYTSGSPKGWGCTASGTPGTWISEGNL